MEDEKEEEEDVPFLLLLEEDEEEEDEVEELEDVFEVPPLLGFFRWLESEEPCCLLLSTEASASGM